MIVGLSGVIAGNQGGYPPYGQLLSQSCTQITITDANGNEYTGNYNSHKVFADGNGGTYSTDETGADSCYLPNGYTFSTSTYSFDVIWSGCSNSGTLTNAGTWYYSQYADGAGGTITNDSPSSWNYSSGYYIYDDTVSCRVVLDTSASPWYTTESYGNAPYGTKIGTPYWSDPYVMQDIADGSGGVIAITWDGYAPWPPYGTQLATANYGCGSFYDAINNSWYLCSYSYQKADGSGGSYYDSVVDGYYPNGYATTGYQVFSDETDGSWYVYDNGGMQVYPWRYGYYAADGYGSSYRTYTSAPYGTQLSSYFTDSYSGYYGYIASDGYGGYYFSY